MPIFKLTERGTSHFDPCLFFRSTFLVSGLTKVMIGLSDVEYIYHFGILRCYETDRVLERLGFPSAPKDEHPRPPKADRSIATTKGLIMLMPTTFSTA